MAKLEELKAGTVVKSLSSTGLAKVVQIEWFGDRAIKVTYEDAAGAVQNRLAYLNGEDTLEAVVEEKGKRLRLTVHRDPPVRVRSRRCD